VQVVVKLFGSVREAAGVKELSVALPDGARLRELRDLLAREHPAVEALGERLAASVNYDVVSFDTPLHDGDEVALLPPVAGGSGGCCWLSEAPLDAAAVVARVSGPGMGGIVTFVGAVRDRARGHEIRHLEYEAYPGMAEREMEKIASEAAERWPGVRVSIAHRAGFLEIGDIAVAIAADAAGRWPGARLAIAHRVGHLEIGDLAVVVAAAAPHRAEAFAACRFAIDTLKEKVPIWKKEFATDGEYWVDERP
jgi:molybdopterin synthase catalytic subunit